MSTNDTYLAIFLGSKTSPKMKAWNSLPEADRRDRRSAQSEGEHPRRPGGGCDFHPNRAGPGAESLVRDVTL